MSFENTSTPTCNVQLSKKRELPSPEFDIESKKNKLASCSSVSDTDTSIPSPAIMAENTEEMSDPSPSQEPHITIPHSEMAKLADMLKETFRGEILGMVDSVVDGVLKGLFDRISSLEKVNQDLVKENKVLVERVESLERQADQAEQYSRRNCLRVSGLKEEENENTDDLILKIASAVGSDIVLADIDRSHRVGNPKGARRRPRDTIVKFATYRSRLNLYRKRTSLKDTGYRGVFVNEDLTKVRSYLLYEARKLFKSKSVLSVWSSDGNIYVRDKHEVVHRIAVLSDLDRFS